VGSLTDRITGFIGGSIFLFTTLYSDIYQGGNYTEIYALLPQVLNFYAIIKYIKSGQRCWVSIVGALTALAFLFKPTYIATGLVAIAIILSYDLRHRSMTQAVRNLPSFMIGMIFPLGIVVFYWGIMGALPELWNGSIMFNLRYAHAGFTMENIRLTYEKLVLQQPLNTLLVLSLMGCLLFFFQNFRGFSTERESSVTKNDLQIEAQTEGWKKWSLTALFFAVPLELSFLFLSGRAFGHYFLTPLPVLAMCSAYFISRIRLFIKKFFPHKISSGIFAALLLFILIPWGKTVIPSVFPKKYHLNNYSLPFSRTYIEDPLIKVVLEHSEPLEFVLIWHIHPSINFLSGRQAPSRYLFPTHLFYPSDGEQSRFDQFMEDLQNHPPVLILTQEVSSAGIPFFGAEGDKLCPSCSPEAKEGMLELKSYVEQYFTHLETIGEWVIFKRNP
jgi:hypothetical protein